MKASTNGRDPRDCMGGWEYGSVSEWVFDVLARILVEAVETCQGHLYNCILIDKVVTIELQ